MLENITLPLTYLAAADFTGKKYHAVKISADRTVAIAGAGEQVHGWLMDEPNVAGKQAAVALDGLVQVKAGAAFAAGARLKSDANGKMVTVGAAEDFFCVAEEAATAENDIIPCVVMHGQA
jgi:Uncharacterized conserved protein (DUF2190)